MQSTSPSACRARAEARLRILDVIEGRLETMYVFTLAWVDRVVRTLSLAILSYAGALGQNVAPPDFVNRRFTLGAGVDFNSNYIWRGIPIDGPVIQPTAWISAWGFTLTGWGSSPLGTRSEDEQVRVCELSLSYLYQWNELNVEPQMVAYASSGAAAIWGRNTIEGSLRLSYPVGPVLVSAQHSVDVLAYKGAYFGEVEGVYRRQMAKKAWLELALDAGWGSARFNSVYLDERRWAVNVAGVRGSLTIYAKPYLYIQPHFGFRAIPDRRIRDSLEVSTMKNFGLFVGFEF